MRIANEWKEYEIIDTSNGEKIERWGEVTLIRPDPQIIWKTERSSQIWDKANAYYVRSNKGGGHWEYNNNINDSWVIGYKGLKFNIKPTGFKHTGLFPEQAVNWDLFINKIKSSNRDNIQVLNLFAYTGGATLACAKAGASVCHVDASKGMVSWAKDNARISNLLDKPIRWIVDDCEKFINREIKRGKKYDIIIMDPPSYGRGPNGEIWKLEDNIYKLVDLCIKIMSERPIFFALNSYTTGLSPSVMGHLLGVTFLKKFGGKVSYDEIGLPVKNSGFVLPCGSTAIWEK